MNIVIAIIIKHINKASYCLLYIYIFYFIYLNRIDIIISF